MKKKIISMLIGLMLIPTLAFPVALVSGTTVSGAILGCMSEAGTVKTLILTATSGANSFVIVEDGASVKTISISSSVEKWTARQAIKSLTVTISGAGTGTGTFTCDK